MDDVMLDCIPHTWPLVTQLYLISKLLGGLYNVAENPVSEAVLDPRLWLTNWQEFPEGSRRREALLSKVTLFLKSRASTAQEWDTALFRLSISAAKWRVPIDSCHSVHCWHVSRSPECICVHAHLRHLSLDQYEKELAASALVQHFSTRNRKDTFSQDCFEVLKFFISLSETSQLATELSPFIPTYVLFLLPCCVVLTLCSEEVISGSPSCSNAVPRASTCTTPLGLYARPLCQNCQNETRMSATVW